MNKDKSYAKFVKEIKSIYLKLRKQAEKEYNNQNYEMSLKYIKTLSRYMYIYNLIYCDNKMEKLLSNISKKVIAIKPYDSNKKNVLYYDFIGLDRRGLSYIYIKALVRLGYRVIYITENKKKSEYSGIEKMVLDSGGKIYVIDGSEEIKKAKRIAYIVQAERPESMFIYASCDDVAMMLVSYACENINQRYMINLTDHAFWIGTKALDYCIEFREMGYVKSCQKRHIPKEKLMILPYYPINLDEKVFKGFSFSTEGKRIIYSGGSIYKIEGSDKYLKIISHILDRYNDTIIYYTGKGKSAEKIKEWIKDNNYANRFILQSEREDFAEVMKRCYFYLNTYPLEGGLMTQYAVKNGKLPVTLADVPAHVRELLINCPEDCEYITNDYNKIIHLIDKLLQDENELKRMEQDLNQMIMTEEKFASGLKDCIIKHETKYKGNAEKNDYYDYTKISLERTGNDYVLLINTLNMYIPNLVKNRFVWLYLKKWLQKRR